MKKGRKIWHIALCIAGFAALIAAVMFLWNLLIPSIIGWSTINYWQALGLMVLIRLLFGGFHHGHGHWHSAKKRKFRKMHNHFHEEIDGMSMSEKREYIRKKMACFCDGGDRNDNNINDANDK